MREEMPYGLFLQHRKVKASAFEVLKSIVVSENNTIPNDKKCRHNISGKIFLFFNYYPSRYQKDFNRHQTRINPRFCQRSALKYNRCATIMPIF